MPDDAQLSLPAHGMTPRQVATYLHVGPDRVRGWIRSGELGAVNTAGNLIGKARFVVLPHHLAEWERSRQAGPPPKRQRRKRQQEIDFFPD